MMEEDLLEKHCWKKKNMSKLKEFSTHIQTYREKKMNRSTHNIYLVNSDKSTFDVTSYPFIFVGESWILFLTFFLTPKPKRISNPFSSRAATGIRVGQTDSIKQN